jgi:hypothetical protein
MSIPQPHRQAVRLFFFWCGIVATFAYRIIIFFTDANPFLLKLSWYIGTIGFIIYFAHRFQIAERRTKVIAEYHLAEKVPQLKELNTEERAGMEYIFSTLGSTRERWNYIFIFIMSAIALIAGTIIDVIGIGK